MADCKGGNIGLSDRGGGGAPNDANRVRLGKKNLPIYPQKCNHISVKTCKTCFSTKFWG